MIGNFCCDQFQWDWKVDRVCGTNIRIIKIDINENPEIDAAFPFRFYITVGYEKGQRNVARRMINFCPYCGTYLKDFYHSDGYINETDHSFYTVE